MSRANTFIRFPLAAAMLAAMGTSTGGTPDARAGGCDCGMVARADLPAPALDAIVREAGGLDFGPVTLCEREGSTVYSADMVRDGHATGVEVDAAGAVKSVTTEIEAWELPLAVKRVVDAETLGFPARSYLVRTTGDETLYVVDAATPRRGKRLEISEGGIVLSKELKIG
ncbi:MAG: hypothetical protein Q8L55_06415 [Phycisphaerales bacterium]|nr:hypothetical protein [Phycisphaerales bacterium]